MFKLEIYPPSASEPIVKFIELVDDDAVLQETKALIAVALDAPGAFVSLAADGQFTVGAGFRVKRGRYVLQDMRKSGPAR